MKPYNCLRCPINSSVRWLWEVNTLQNKKARDNGHIETISSTNLTTCAPHLDNFNHGNCNNVHDFLMSPGNSLPRWLVYCSVCWLVVWFVVWFFGLLVSCLVCWLVGSWFVGCLVCWFIVWFVCLLVGWLLVCWLVGSLVGWLVLWFVGWLFGLFVV